MVHNQRFVPTNLKGEAMHGDLMCENTIFTIVLKNLSEEVRQANAGRAIQRAHRCRLLRLHVTQWFQHWRVRPGESGYKLAQDSFI